MDRTVLAAAALSWLAATAVGAAEPSALIASALPTIDKADQEWFAAVKSGDVALEAEPYGPDAVFVMRDGTSLKGREAILKLFEGRAAAMRQAVSGEIVRDGTAEGGQGLVYEWGHGGITTRDAGGHEVRSEGPYFTVWRRDASGRWRIIRNLVF